MTKKTRGSAPVHRAARPATLADVVIALKRARGSRPRVCATSFPP